jgi:hypothetical protein
VGAVKSDKSGKFNKEDSQVQYKLKILLFKEEKGHKYEKKRKNRVKEKLKSNHFNIIT